MKKKRLTLKTAGGCRLLLLALLSLFVTVEGWATATTYYYKATATASPTGGGTVYIKDNNSNPVNETGRAATVTLNGQRGGYTLVGNASTSLNLQATPNVGYNFVGWYRGNTLLGNGASSVADNITFDGASNNRTSFSYTARFETVTGMVQAYSNDGTKGSVSIDNPNNRINETVTITASPYYSQGYDFLGWRKNNSGTGDYVSTENPYTLTVTTNETYYAYFSDKADVVYFLLKNKQTGRYLSVYGNGRAQPHTSPYKYLNSTFDVNNGYLFVNGLKLINEESAKGNPTTVLKRTNSSQAPILSDVVVNGQNFSTNTLIGDENHNFTFAEQDDGTFRVYTTVSTTVSYLLSDRTVSLQCGLYDEDGDWVTMKAFEELNTDEEKARASWEVYYLTESQTEGAFGAYAKSRFTQDDKYYTVLYAPFAYKLLDGVKAYYLPADEESYNEEKNVISFEEIPTGEIVPANTAVVLECLNADGPTKNRLLPVVDASDAEAISSNLLGGHTEVYSLSNDAVYTVPNNDKQDFVFSINGDGKIGFYHYSEQYLPANKAYLRLPVPLSKLKGFLSGDGEPNQLAKTVTISFGKGEDDATGITLSNVVVDDADASYYDLQGRKVNTLRSGLYIKKNGKKVIVK